MDVSELGPPPGRRIAEAIARGGGPPATTRDPDVRLRYGTVQAVASGSPPTVSVLVEGSATPAALGVLRCALPLDAGEVVLLAQLGSDLVVVASVANIDPTWQPLAPYLGTSIVSWNARNSSTTFHEPAFRRGPGDMVQLRGLLAASGAVAGDSVLFTLPGGFRPARQVLVNVDWQGTSMRLDIWPNGTAHNTLTALATNDYVSLGGGEDVGFSLAAP